MLRYAYHHGVSTLVLENPEIMERLRLFWIRNGDIERIGIIIGR